MEAKYYKQANPEWVWKSFIKITDRKTTIFLWDDSTLELNIDSFTHVQSDYLESSRSEFEMAKLKLSNYIETL